jgi:hypothetical protein
MLVLVIFSTPSLGDLAGMVQTASFAWASIEPQTWFRERSLGIDDNWAQMRKGE